MSVNASPENGDQYFKSFGTYLRTGDIKQLKRVFPQAENLEIAAVYRNGFFRGSMTALEASYPSIEKLVGKEYFDFLARAYVEHYPPARGTFIGYGEAFPSFLAENEAQHELPYLADFARLDCAWLNAYFAEDSVLLSEQDVETWQAAGNDIGALGACLPASATLLTLNFKASKLWLMLKADETPEDRVHIDPGTENLLVWRNALDQINVRVTSEGEFAFLAGLIDGSALAVAATAALSVQDDFPVAAYLSELLDTQVLAVK